MLLRRNSVYSLNKVRPLLGFLSLIFRLSLMTANCAKYLISLGGWRDIGTGEVCLDGIVYLLTIRLDRVARKVVDREALKALLTQSEQNTRYN